MPFYSYFENIFFILQHQHNNIVVMAVFIVLHILVIALRVIVFMGYRGNSMLLAADLHPSKALKSTAGVSEIRSTLLRRVASDYVNAAEKNAPRVPLEAIISKHMLSLSLVGWRFTAISGWLDKFENSSILLGLILALIFPQYAVVYGLLAVLGFILVKLSASLFNYEIAEKLLATDIHVYVEQEVGRFFAGHMAGAVNRFKEEVTEAMDRQGALLKTALDDLQCLSKLPEALDKMIDSNDRYALHHEAFMAQSQMIKDSQSALENSLATYETTLQNLVQTMGNGMGTFIQMHGQNAANSLAASLDEHIARVSLSNRETLQAISSLTEQLTAQSRDISAHLRALHERITEL